jgi:hypothetical protein
MQVPLPVDLWIGSEVMGFDLVIDYIPAAHAPPCLQPRSSTLHIDIVVHHHETVTAFATHPRSSFGLSCQKDVDEQELFWANTAALGCKGGENPLRL